MGARRSRLVIKKQKINHENYQNKISSNLAEANFLNKRKTLPM